MLLATNFLPGCFMTRKKKLVCFAIVAALIPAVYFFMRPSVPKHNINPASLEKIENGMTLADVEAILGVPSGDYTTGPTTSIRNRLWGREEKNGQAMTASLSFGLTRKIEWRICVLHP